MSNEIINNYRDSGLGIIGSLTAEPHCLNCIEAYECEHPACIEDQLMCDASGRPRHVNCGNICDKHSDFYDPETKTYRKKED